jgi:hypothetical protein
MDLVRVQQATPYTIQKQWTEDGVAVDPGTVTIGITAADGTVVVAPGTSTNGTGTAVRGFLLTTTHTALLDNLTATWTSTLKGTLTTRVEVVGGFLFSIADARAVRPLDNTTTYPTAKIVEMRTLVEDAMEQVAGVAFVPRYAQETVTDATGSWLPSWPYVSSVRSLYVDDVLTAGAILAGNGTVYLPSSYPYSQAVTIGYEHGHPYPPPRIARAALFEARYRLIQANSPTDDRAVRLDTEQGSYALQQPGRGGMNFYLPETDAAVAAYSMVANVR